MRKLSAVLRAELIPRRYKWVAEGLLATVAAFLAYACLVWLFPELWLWGLIWAAIALSHGLHATGAVAEKLIRRRARQRARDGGCVRCGYDLRNLQSRQCPECGAAFIACRATPPAAAR